MPALIKKSIKKSTESTYQYSINQNNNNQNNNVTKKLEIVKVLGLVVKKFQKKHNSSSSFTSSQSSSSFSSSAPSTTTTKQTESTTNYISRKLSSSISFKKYNNYQPEVVIYQQQQQQSNITQVVNPESTTTIKSTNNQQQLSIKVSNETDYSNNNDNEDQENGFQLFGQLSEELILYICKNFSLSMVCKVRLVCKDMQRFMDDVSLWRHIVTRRWLVNTNSTTTTGVTFPSPSAMSKYGPKSTFEWQEYYKLRQLLTTKNAVVSSVVSPKGAVPSQRYQHTGTVIGNSIYYIGGQETQVRRFNDIYRYNTETNRFTKIEVQGQVAPPKFARHTSVAIGTKIYVFGGFDGSGVYFDLSVFDTERLTWTNPMVGGNPPRSRTNHAAAAIGHNLYVFGGINRDSSWDLQDLDEFYVFNTITNYWSPVRCTGDKPSARCGHRLVAIGSNLYLFGGGAGDSWRERFNDIHIFNTQTGVWRRVPPSPQVRVCTFSCVFVLGFLIGIFGGQHLVKGKVTKKLYFFDTFSETFIKPCKQPTPSCTSALSALHHQALVAASQSSAEYTQPKPRDMASSDVVNGTVYILGGYDGIAMSDLNTISLSPQIKKLSYFNN